MSDRDDIEPNTRGWRRLSYTCRCGWVDWGHALPGSAIALKRQIDNEVGSWPLLDGMDVTLDGQAAYLLAYGQAMGAGPLRVSTVRHWVVKKGLSQQEREQVALGIFLNASYGFEKLQGTFPYSLVTGDSSFSPEDLVSNLIGFYSAFRSTPQEKMREICREVSVKESYRVWDAHLPDGLSGVRNKTPRPILFPSRECGAGAADTAFPSALENMQPVDMGKLWVRLRQRFVDGRLLSSKTPINVTRDGVVVPR